MEEWNDVSIELPKLSGWYDVKYASGEKSIGRYNRGFLGLSIFSYWSDGRFVGETVTSWKARAL
jgi:hypothetical protein